jgi:hypothetical protein
MATAAGKSFIMLFGSRPLFFGNTKYSVEWYTSNTNGSLL